MRFASQNSHASPAPSAFDGVKGHTSKNLPDAASYDVKNPNSNAFHDSCPPNTLDGIKTSLSWTGPFVTPVSVPLGRYAKSPSACQNAGNAENILVASCGQEEGQDNPKYAGDRASSFHYGTPDTNPSTLISCTPEIIPFSSSLSSSHSSSLGSNSRPASKKQGLELVASLNAERFALQSGARHLLPGERVAACLRRRQRGKDCVQVWYLQQLKRARFGNLQTCASVWMCPVCAAKITERRKLELTAALVAAEAQGLQVVMATYTLRHGSGDSLRWLLDGLTQARKKSTGGRAAQALRASCGVVGSVRALEVTWGEDCGWHPHIHELLFVAVGADLAALEIGLRSQWDAGLRLAGMREVNEHGFELTCCNIDIAAYVEKFGRERSWNVEHELTKQPVKKGRQGRYTPAELLRGFTLDGDADLGAKWVEFALTLKGSRQLYWSAGLKKMLLPAVAEVTDEELAEETTAAGTLLAELHLLQWQAVLHHDARAQVLSIAASGDKDALMAFVAGLGANPDGADCPQARSARTERAVGVSTGEEVNNNAGKTTAPTCRSGALHLDFDTLPDGECGHGSAVTGAEPPGCARQGLLGVECGGWYDVWT